MCVRWGGRYGDGGACGCVCVCVWREDQVKRKCPAVTQKCHKPHVPSPTQKTCWKTRVSSCFPQQRLITASWQKRSKIFLNMSALVSLWNEIPATFMTSYVSICLFSEALSLCRGPMGKHVFWITSWHCAFGTNSNNVLWIKYSVEIIRSKTKEANCFQIWQKKFLQLNICMCMFARAYLPADRLSVLLIMSKPFKADDLRWSPKAFCSKNSLLEWDIPISIH